VSLRRRRVLSLDEAQAVGIEVARNWMLSVSNVSPPLGHGSVAPFLSLNGAMPRPY